MFERFTACNAICPRTKQLRLAQPAQFTVDEEKYLLQNVFGKRPPADQARDVTIERLLEEAKQMIERFAVAGLSQQHPADLLFGAFHLRPPRLMRLIVQKRFEWDGNFFSSVHTNP